MNHRSGPVARFFNSLIDAIGRITEPFFAWLEGRAPEPPPDRSAEREERRARIERNISSNPAMVQTLFGLLRLLLAFSILVSFSLIGGYMFEQVDAVAIAQRIHDTNPLLHPMPMWMLRSIIYVFHPDNARYMLLPLAATLTIVIGAAYFVSDVYHLSSPKLGLRYVVASLFAFRYPTLTVDGGKKVIQPGKVNLLDAIGGPGYLLIQPGNAVLFRTLRRPSRTSVTSSYFMSPFETLGQIASLDDQHGCIEEIATVSRDGIQITLREIHFRFRILPEMCSGRPVLRSQDNPFPFSEDAMQTIIYNLPVTVDGQDPWRSAVTRSVTEAIAGYVNSQGIDFLTAPRERGLDPRGRLHEELAAHNREALRNLGAELIWIDVGRFDIHQPEVDFKRVDYWSAGWESSARMVHAEGEAKRLAYRELGRAYAQSELIKTLIQAINSSQPKGAEKENLRSLMLFRTAQILDAIRERSKEQE